MGPAVGASLGPLRAIVSATIRAKARSVRETPRAGRGSNGREVRAIKARLSDLYESVLAGRVSRDVGSVLAQIANIQLRALSLEREIRQTDDLVVQVERLEDEVRTRIGDQ